MTHDGQCLLCDFGLSRIKHEITRTLTIASHGGRQRFLAPEICDPEAEETRINESSDIYSLAMTIYALGTRSMPFADLTNGRARQAAVRGERPSKPDSLGGLTADDTKFLWSLMERMWNGRPELRPIIASVRDIMKDIPMWSGSAPTHRAPQPLDGGAIPGSVGRASSSVMPVTGTNDTGPGAEDQVSRDNHAGLLLYHVIELSAQSGTPLYSNAELARRPAPITLHNSRFPGSAITVTTQHGYTSRPSASSSHWTKLNSPTFDRNATIGSDKPVYPALFVPQSKLFPPSGSGLDALARAAASALPSEASMSPPDSPVDTADFRRLPDSNGRDSRNDGAPIAGPQAGFASHLSRAPPHALSQEFLASSTTSTLARSAAAQPGDRRRHPRRGVVPLADRLCSECGRPEDSKMEGV